MSKDTFILFLILLYTTIALQNQLYKKVAIYQTKTTIDAFSAYKEDEVKIALGSRVQGNFVLRIFQLIQADKKLQLLQILDPIEAQDFYIRFSAQAKFLIVAINQIEIRVYKETQDKNKSKRYLLIQTIQLEQKIKTINVCQKHGFFAISTGKQIKFYKQQKDQFLYFSEFSFDDDITAISISPDKKWISASNNRVVFVLQMNENYQLKQYCLIHIEDDFRIDFIITIDETRQIFALHEATQQNGGGSIKIFGQNASNPHQYIQKEYFNNFTDFPRSMSVSDNGKVLAFFTEHNRIWIYQKNQGNKMKCSYCLKQSFTTNNHKLNHLWATSYGQYLIMSSDDGEITIFKNMQGNGSSLTTTIIIIIVVACIIGFVIYSYKKRQTNKQKGEQYFEMKQTPKF